MPPDLTPAIPSTMKSPTAAPSTPPDLVMALRLAIGAADAERQALAEAGDLDALAAGLVQVKQLSRDLSTLARSVEDDVAKIMAAAGDKRREVVGVGVLETRKGTDRKEWDSAGLAKEVVRRALDPDGVGEFPTDPVEAMVTAVDALTKCAPFTGSLGWRVTALRELGIDPAEWCASSPGRTTVQIHGAAS